MAESVRPTKKQRELLEFIDSFIKQHNYSPSYREIMAGLNYTSVATVSLHINNLIKRGHLIRREGKARSLEVRHQDAADGRLAAPETPQEWLVAQVDSHIKQAEATQEISPDHLSAIETLLEALSILDIDAGDHDFDGRLQTLRT